MVARTNPRTSHYFKPGHAKMGGRQKGVLNRATRHLKDAVIAAAEAVGEDGKGLDGLLGYCVMLAKKEPRTFTSLLVKAIPMEITGDAERPLVIQMDPKVVERLPASKQEVWREVLRAIAAGTSEMDIAAAAISKPKADPARYAQTLRLDTATEGEA